MYTASRGELERAHICGGSLLRQNQRGSARVGEGGPSPAPNHPQLQDLAAGSTYPSLKALAANGLME